MTKLTSIKQITFGTDQGKWAKHNTKKAYFTSTVAATQKEAFIKAIFEDGIELDDRLRDVQKKLEELGAVDSQDPYGWRA